MAFSHVPAQQITVTFADSDSGDLPYNNPVTSGNLLLCSGGCYTSSANGPSLVSVTDTIGTSYSVFLSAGVARTTGHGKGFIAYGVAPVSGANTVTVNPATTQGQFNFSIDEWSGNSSAPLDVDGGETSGLSSEALDSLTTTTTGDLLINVVVCSTVGTSEIFLKNTEWGHVFISSNQPRSSQFRVVSSVGTYSMGADFEGVTDWNVYTAAFKVAGAVAAPVGGNGGEAHAQGERMPYPVYLPALIS